MTVVVSVVASALAGTAAPSVPTDRPCPLPRSAAVSARGDWVQIGPESYFVQGPHVRRDFESLLLACYPPNIADAFDAWRAARRTTFLVTLGTVWFTPFAVGIPIAAADARRRGDSFERLLSHPGWYESAGRPHVVALAPSGFVIDGVAVTTESGVDVLSQRSVDPRLAYDHALLANHWSMGGLVVGTGVVIVGTAWAAIGGLRLMLSPPDDDGRADARSWTQAGFLAIGCGATVVVGASGIRLAYGGDARARAVAAYYDGELPLDVTAPPRLR